MLPKEKTQSQGAHRLTHALALVLLALHAEELRAIALDWKKWKNMLTSLAAFICFQYLSIIPSILLRHEVMSYRNNPQRASVARLLQLISWIRYWPIRAAPELPSSSVFQHRNVWPLCLICRSTWVKTVLFWLNFWLVFYSISLFYDFYIFLSCFSWRTVYRPAKCNVFVLPVTSHVLLPFMWPCTWSWWGGVGWGGAC